MLKQDHLELIAWNHVQMAFGCLLRWRLHNLCQCSVTLSKKAFPYTQMELPVFLPIAIGPVTGHHWKEPVCPLCTPVLQIYLH